MEVPGQFSSSSPPAEISVMGQQGAAVLNGLQSFIALETEDTVGDIEL